MYKLILQQIKKVNHVIPAHGEGTVQRKQSQTKPDIELEESS